MTFCVTHYDQAGCRRRFHICATTAWAAMDQAEQLFGEARHLRALRISSPQASHA